MNQLLKEHLYSPVDLIVPNTNNIDLWKYQIKLEKELERIELGVKINFFWALNEGETEESLFVLYGMKLKEDGKLYYHTLSNKENNKK